MELNTHTAAYYREKEYKAFSAIPGMNAFLSASSEAERMELEKAYPDAAFVWMISGNLVGRDREQCEIHQKAYYAILNGESISSVHFRYDEAMRKYVERHLWDD